MTKADSQKAHFNKRTLERFGFVMTEEEQSQLISEIQNNQWALVRKQSKRVSIFVVCRDEHNMAVVYDRDRKTLITAMPVEWTERIKLKPRGRMSRRKLKKSWRR